MDREMKRHYTLLVDFLGKNFGAGLRGGPA